MSVKRVIIIIIFSVPACFCGQYFLTMSELGKQPIPWEQINITKYDYFFGDCTNKNKSLQVHVQLDRTAVLEKFIIRDWLDIQTLPTCVMIRQKIYEVPVIYKPPDFQLQICVAKIVYIHRQKRWIYYYYEWFKPVEVLSNADWDIYFYSSGTPDWH